MIELLKYIGQVFTWFVIVAPWEACIRVRLGKNAALLGPGFYLRIPFVDRVFKQSIRRRPSIIRPQTLTTRDMHVVTVSGALGYAISDMVKLYDTLECAHDTIENEVAGRVARFIGATDRIECTSLAIEAALAGQLDLKRYGLSGEEFLVTSLASAKTYRLIMGDFPSWSNDSVLHMKETNQP